MYRTNFITKYLVMCKVYTNVGSIKYLYHDCPLVGKIIHSLKRVGYLHVQSDKQPDNHYLSYLQPALIIQALSWLFLPVFISAGVSMFILSSL